MPIQKIGIDIGYGDTKVFYNGEVFKFASAVEPIKETQVNLNEKRPDVYTYNGRQYRVGDKAASNAIATRGVNFLHNYSPLLIYHAINLINSNKANKFKIDLNEPIYIATGLSLVNLNQAKDFMKSIGNFFVDGINLKPKIFLFAQGQGIFFDHSTKTKTDSQVLVIDIGYNTVDFLVFEDGEPRSDLCFATKGGANKIITDLQNILTRNHGVEFGELEAKKVFLDNGIKLAGEFKDYKDVICNMTNHYIEYIYNEVSNRWDDLLMKADEVIVGGGGAYFLNEEAIKAFKSRANISLTNTPYEFANVRGYYLGAFGKDKPAQES